MCAWGKITNRSDGTGEDGGFLFAPFLDEIRETSRLREPRGESGPDDIEKFSGARLCQEFFGSPFRGEFAPWGPESSSEDLGCFWAGKRQEKGKEGGGQISPSLGGSDVSS